MAKISPSLRLPLLALAVAFCLAASRSSQAWAAEPARVERGLVRPPQGPARLLEPASGRRRALVIGNQAYAEAPLHNPKRDAEEMARLLRSLGFDVTLHTDLELPGLARAAGEYLERVAPGDLSFVFYAGHGLQVQGENYLVPVDFAATEEAQLGSRAYPVSTLVMGLEGKRPRVNVVVLDACRNNPFRGSRSGPRGLGTLTAAVGTLIAFATAANETADDGPPGGSGTFTASLLRALALPGLDIEEVFKTVREDVARKTANRQVPFTYSGIVGRYVLKEATPSITWQARAPARAAVPGALKEMAEVAGEGPVESFLLDRREVTVAEYARCVKAGRCPPALEVYDYPGITPEYSAAWSRYCNGEREERAHHPANCIDWWQAADYCAWVGKRLPTEQELEWAAGGGKARTRYPWGEGPPKGRVCWGSEVGARGTCPVGSFPEGDSPHGVQDLAGSVFEWTTTRAGCKELDKRFGVNCMVARGGAWSERSPIAMAATFRSGFFAQERGPGLGFRCARTP